MALSTAQEINHLRELLNGQLKYLDETLMPLDTDSLNWRPAEKSWSRLEVVEHLNRYCAIYLPLLADAVKNGKPQQSDAFRPGWLGNWLAMAMKPEGKKIPYKMPSFRSKNPLGEALERDVLYTQRANLESFGDILDRADRIDWTANRLATDLGNWSKLKFGDAIRFFFFHQERHYQQMRNMADALHTANI